MKRRFAFDMPSVLESAFPFSVERALRNTPAAHQIDY